MKSLIVVSNRLPISIEEREGCRQLRTSTGGLVSAMKPIIQRYGGCWIGSADEAGPDVLHSAGAAEGFEMFPVYLPQSLWQEHYAGFCNEILWPLFHDLQSRCNFEPRYWQSYQEANLDFSAAVACKASQHDTIWVHDYHLMLQGSLLGKSFDRSNLLYFHHVPFPPPDVFEKLPWRKSILDGLLGFGLVGFQSSRDRYNFVQCVRRVFPNITLKKTGSKLVIIKDQQETVAGIFPIGIDFADFNRTAIDPQVVREAQNMRENAKGHRLVLGVDRLDYTKGILERVKGFSTLLARYPGLHGHIRLTQIAVPSRAGVRHYSQLKEELEGLIESVNARFGRPAWIPIQYLNRHLSRPELVAYYRAADIALITPIKDGMNLVCKEFCASRVDESGILILSELAGAAHQLRTGALLVNPYDAEGIADALYHAFDMDQRNVSRRMRRMRNVVQWKDVFCWCSEILNSIRSISAPPRIGPHPDSCVAVDSSVHQFRRI